MNVFVHKHLFLCCLITFVFSGCQYIQDNDGTENDSEPAIQDVQEVDSTLFFDEHNARNSLDYAGTYKGILPCADCEGIAVEIRVYYDGGFFKTIEYLGVDEGIVFEYSGNYTWNDAGNTITLRGLEIPNQYFVAEERLFHLDMDGQRITGDLADHYVLHKTY